MNTSGADGARVGSSSRAEGRGRDRRQRRRLTVDTRRDELIQAALRLFSTRPLDQVSMDDVAEEARASRALVYHYFGNKQDLYLEAILNAAAMLEEQLVIEGEMSPLERITASVGQYLDFARDHGTAFLALFREGSFASMPALKRAIENVRERVLSVLLDLLDAKGASPVLRTTARAWLAAVESASLDWLDRRDVLSRPELEHMLVDQLVAMLRAASKYDPTAGWLQDFLEAPPAERAG